MDIATFARRLVSGNKARFRDEGLGVDLDLAYLTDEIIMMGYPASGVEAFYRNKGKDVRKFLEHRHGKNYWVFNFCPLNENSYPPELFDNRVSRYPFPDHHAPPLAILALATREMKKWLSADSSRVIVLHCKAGKGRTGTLACAYLLSTGQAPSPPKLKRSYSDRQWAQLTAEKLVRAVDSEDSDASDSESASKRSQPTIPSGAATPVKAIPARINEIGQTSEKANISQTSLDAILELHSSRRMKAPDKEAAKESRGVSIPSQRRFLFYWSLLVLSPLDVPLGFWSTNPPKPEERPKCYLRSMRIRMKQTMGFGRAAINLFNSALELTGQGGDKQGVGGDIWVSLSRYEDSFVDLLEEWEIRTRSPSNITSTKDAVGAEGVETHEEKEGWDVGTHGIFKDGKWDSGKMVKSFARLGEYNKEDVKVETTEAGTNHVHSLLPLPPVSWVHVDRPVQLSKVYGEADNSSTTDLQGASEAEVEEDGILLDANRELRAKLYIGEVPFGWFWFIPAFHMPKLEEQGKRPHCFTLSRKEVDFPLGPGTWLVDVEMELAWAGTEARHFTPREPKKGASGDHTAGLVAGALAEGQVSSVKDAVAAEEQT